MLPESLKGAICWLSLLGLLSGCNRQPQDSQRAQQTSPTADSFRTHFQDESQFIVEAVLTDLAEMAVYAQNGQRPVEVAVAATERPGSQFRQPSYEVKIVTGKKVVRKRLDVVGPIWSPELYEDFARTLLGGGSAASSREDRNDVSVLVALTDLRASTIETENQRISGLLEWNFNDPELHEKAAVVLGTFALREFSGDFYDVRPPLCRMTAHLALARALSGKSGGGVNGRAAEVLLLTLMNNQKSALEKLAVLESEPRLKPWANALRVRNTYDYRPLQGAIRRTRLESVMFYNAISQCISSDAGWEELGSDVVDSSSDFARIALAGNFSVGLGHVLVESSLPLELAEIMKLRSLVSGGGSANGEELIKFLNQIPERCFLAGTNRVRIIGPGQWAMFLQRHLCHVLVHHFTFLHSMWGVPDEARDFAAQADAQFGKLSLYPFVRRFNATTEAEYHRAVDGGVLVIMTTPHWVAPGIWNHLSSRPRFAARYWPGFNSHVDEWHKHNPPPGTAYDPGPRLAYPSLVNRSDSVTVLGQLHELAPYDASIADGLLERKYHGNETFQQAEGTLRPLLAYSARQNLRLAKHASGDPVQYEEIMVRYAKLNPAGYFTLGRYFADRQAVEKAAEYYEKGVQLGADAVQMSNNCDWLVRYYFNKGEREKAEALADRAAEVYSSAGLRAKAGLMEMENKYEEALEYYRRNEERYDQPGPLVGFCVRYKAETADSRFEKLVQERFKTLFPRGIEQVKASDFKSAPTEGVLISEDNDALRQAGLKKGDLIVALDGMRVYDMTQYLYVRELTNATDMSFIVWNGREFSEKNAHPPKRRFGVPFTHYYQPNNR